MGIGGIGISGQYLRELYTVKYSFVVFESKPS